MKRLTLIASVAAVGLAGAAAMAQPSPSTPPGPAPTGSERPADRFTRADAESMLDARVSALKAGLRLTPEQDKLWGPLEQALREAGKTRIDRWEERRRMREAMRANPDQQRPDLMQRLEQRSERAAVNARNAKALADALKPLWATLDERQKRILPMLLRPHGSLGSGWRGHHGMMGMPGMMMPGMRGMRPDGDRGWGPPGRDDRRENRGGWRDRDDDARSGRDRYDDGPRWRDRDGGPRWRDRDERSERRFRDRDDWRDNRRWRDRDDDPRDRDDEWRRL